MNKLKIYRRNINNIDSQIFKLLAERLTLVKKIGIYKKLNGIKIFDKKRENLILKKIKMQSKKYKTNEEYMENIFKSIMKNSRKIQKYN